MVGDGIVMVVELVGHGLGEPAAEELAELREPGVPLPVRDGNGGWRHLASSMLRLMWSAGVRSSPRRACGVAHPMTGVRTAVIARSLGKSTRADWASAVSGVRNASQKGCSDSTAAWKESSRAA
ncbi:hypothetical protein M2169_005347 [Streptomyces sp. MJP52]|nr:hypothetical protein [Streptomyces sp. MJP52]